MNLNLKAYIMRSNADNGKAFRPQCNWQKQHITIPWHASYIIPHSSQTPPRPLNHCIWKDSPHNWVPHIIAVSQLHQWQLPAWPRIRHANHQFCNWRRPSKSKRLTIVPIATRKLTKILKFKFIPFHNMSLYNIIIRFCIGMSNLRGESFQNA